MMSVRRMIVSMMVAVCAGQISAQVAWNSAAVNDAAYNTTGSGSFIWSDAAAWAGGQVPVNAAGQFVSLEPRMGVAATVTIDGTYTVGRLASRSANVDGYAAGTGKLIFDNGAETAIWNHHSRITRFTSLRRGIAVDLDLQSDLDLRYGTARSNEGPVGTLGGLISGPGRLILSLAMNDSAADRWFDFARDGANTYEGGTLVRHVLRAGSYGTGHGVNARVMLDVLSPGAFGAGEVTIDGTGCTHSMAPYGSRGMVVRFSASEVMAIDASLTVINAGNTAIELAAGTSTTLYRLTVDGVSMPAGVWGSVDNEGVAPEFRHALFLGQGTLVVHDQEELPVPQTPVALSYPETNATGRFMVSWSPSEWATSYKVDRSADGGGSWSESVYVGTATSFLENVEDGQYRYRVAAQNPSGASEFLVGTHDCEVEITEQEFYGLTFYGYSDPHYRSDATAGKAQVNWINNLPGTAYPAAFGGTVDPPRGILMPGDLIDNGANMSLAPTEWANYIADFGVSGEGRCLFPVYEGLGNHDWNPNMFTYDLMKERTLTRIAEGRLVNVSDDGYHYSWDWDGVHFINLNMFGGNIWHGEADTYSGHNPLYARDFLIADLQAHVGNSGRPVFVMQHFRPVDDNWWTHWSADRLHAVLQDYNVIAILVGHQGGGVSNIWRGINWMSSNGNVLAFRITPEPKLQVAIRGETSWGQEFQKNVFMSYETSGLPAVINNGDWAVNIAASSATLSGRILYEAVSPTEVTVFWGTSDGGTNPANWQFSRNIGVQEAEELFATTVDELQPWTTYHYRVRASNTQGNAWAATSIPFTTRGVLPAKWLTTFIGYRQREGVGAALVDGDGTLVVRGSGTEIGIGNAPDSLQYAYQKLSGDGEIRARVVAMTGTNSSPIAGVMMRETLDDNARNAGVFLRRRDGVRFLARANTGGGSTTTGAGTVSAPYWIRLARSGNSFTAYQSADGESWTQVGSTATVAMPEEVYVGLAVTAGNRNGSQNHDATFDQVTVTGNTAVGYNHWLSEYFTPLEMTDDWLVGPAADPDNNDMPNEHEFIAGTHPRDPQSRFRTEEVWSDDGRLSLSWQGVQGRRYTIYRSASLLTPEWTVHAGPFICDEDGPMFYLDPEAPSGEQQFYRIRVEY